MDVPTLLELPVPVLRLFANLEFQIAKKCSTYANEGLLLMEAVIS